MFSKRSVYLLRPGTFLMFVFPPMLIIVNYSLFQFFTEVAGNKNGYLLGMICYWGLWCVIPFLLFVSRTNRRLLFRIKPVRWWLSVLLIAPVLMAFLFGPFRDRIAEVSPAVVIVSFF